MTGVILAGGENRRMNGRMKALLPFGGETLIERQVREMKRICDELFVVTNQPDLFSPVVGEGVQIVRDEIPFQGPLGGMHTALTRASHDDVWIVGCDLPFLSSRVAQALIACRRRFKCDAVVPVVSGRTHPLHAIYGKACGSVILDLLRQEIRQVKQLLERIHWKRADESFFMEHGLDLRFVTNVNTPEEYKKALINRGTGVEHL
ncbi:molybdenum cofactor guanylyltransferase [Lihuaxuella thermophila]|uniref:molybdenum cofactor guanylyltransferase n=1 Tax=Lihuaxuella thermophila TaxID=1173111 RepID=UPI00147B588B|nr:molybdenum cofactor guanylyltransferase [Lihuaxuella thermophila]